MSINKADNTVRGIQPNNKFVATKQRIVMDEDSIIINAMTILKRRLTGFNTIEQKKKVILIISKKLSDWVEQL